MIHSPSQVRRNRQFDIKLHQDTDIQHIEAKGISNLNSYLLVLASPLMFDR